MSRLETEHPILLFDGVCNLCEASVHFIIKRDPKAIFRFASLQSPDGQVLLEKFNLARDDFDTMVLIEGARCYLRSAAGLRIARRLSGAWPLLSAFLILPRFLRDAIYRWIATNRYRWFGKKEACLVPTSDIRSRFLE